MLRAKMWTFRFTSRSDVCLGPGGPALDHTWLGPWLDPLNGCPPIGAHSGSSVALGGNRSWPHILHFGFEMICVVNIALLASQSNII